MTRHSSKGKIMRHLLLIPLFLIVITIGAILFMLSPLFAVEKNNTSITIEAGKKPEFSPQEFLTGTDWSVNLSIIDSSAVDYKTVGTYPVDIYHGFEKYTHTIEVVDTTAPTLECNIKNITVEKGDYITIDTIGMTAKDNTGIDRLLFKHILAERIHVEGEEEDALRTETLFLMGRDIWTQSYTFEHGGIYLITVAAMDAYNNVTYRSVNVTVEEPPVLEVESDIYLAIGKTIDFTDYITVWDFLDADYSVEDVVLDTSGIDITKAGDYQLLYTAEDDYGLAAEAVTTVHVRSSSALQEMVNTHEINMADHLIVGAPNVYDSGYYEDHNLEYIQDVMLPALIHIENSYNDTFGSGYIVKIDENFVTMATNEHVIVGDLTPEVFFHDGTSRYAAVVAADPREDIAFLRIPINDHDNEACISPEYVETLRTVHINEGYWKKIENDSEITICYTCFDTEGKIWTESTGYLVYKEATRTWNQYENINESIISMEPVGGTSGSAIFDGHGRLIAMVRGYTEYDDYTETVAVPLCEILDYYEMTFHEKLQYQ